MSNKKEKKKRQVLVQMIGTVEYERDPSSSQPDQPIKDLKKALKDALKTFKVQSNPSFEDPSYHVVEDPDDDPP